MNHALIGQIAGLLALLQIIPYVVSIFRGQTKPERMSYFIWLIVDIIAIASYISAGATTTIWAGLIFTLTGFLVFILSIKYGMGGFSPFDGICFLLAIVGVIIWVTSKDPILALYFMTFVGFIGYLPTIKKVYIMPKTESTVSWSLAASASILNLFALTTLMPHIAIPVLCSAISQGVVAWLLIYPSTRFKHTKRRPHRVHTFLHHPVFLR